METVSLGIRAHPWCGTVCLFLEQIATSWRHISARIHAHVGGSPSPIMAPDWKSKHFSWNVTEWKATHSSLRVFSGKLYKLNRCITCKTALKETRRGLTDKTWRFHCTAVNEVDYVKSAGICLSRRMFRELSRAPNGGVPENTRSAVELQLAGKLFITRDFG